MLSVQGRNPSDSATSATAGGANQNQSSQATENLERRPYMKFDINKWNIHFSEDDSGLRVD